ANQQVMGVAADPRGAPIDKQTQNGGNDDDRRSPEGPSIFSRRLHHGDLRLPGRMNSGVAGQPQGQPAAPAKYLKTNLNAVYCRGLPVATCHPADCTKVTAPPPER